MTRSKKRDLRSETENLHGERLKNRAAAPNTFKDSFSIIHILQNNVDKKFVIAPHERSVKKLIESRRILIKIDFLDRRSLFLDRATYAISFISETRPFHI